MAKNTSLTSESKVPKGKKMSSNPEELTNTKVNKKKRKKEETEEVPAQLPLNLDDKTLKKVKKAKKKQQRTEEPEVDQSKIVDAPIGPHCPEEEEDELSPEERRVLERKMKKILKKEEKKKLKAEGAAQKSEPSGPNASQQALDYLTCWAESRAAWRFQKTRQTWLLQHMFDSEKIPEEKFPVLLQYLEGLKGAARETTVQKALTLVELSGQAPEDTAVQQRAHRAREVIQLLS
ncbi:protein cholesin [Gouania willdenowi]|uniref:WKF domain-containing protein n=1 Tax=Gouania willdenowi TaxID=441366 RepID=A0A8C5EDZ7_GOUWI|nr:uncharacterized protein C7orf50 homolog [Gouania willdenowi]